MPGWLATTNLARTNLVAAALAAALVTNAGVAAQAQDYPARPATIVVPYAPGASDVIARFVAEGLSKIWGQAVTVENRAGANGIIGTSYVARSAPDGYTLMFSSGAYTMNPALQPSPNLDPAKDLMAAAIIGTGDYLYVFGAHIPGENAQDFIAAAKKREMIWASVGAGAEFGARTFMEGAGITMKRVPYRGSASALSEMLGGRVDFIVANPGALKGQLDSKQVKPIAVTGKKRSGILPNVQTLEEAGVRNANLEAWWAIFAPSKTPQAVIDKINKGVQEVMESPAGKEFMLKNDITGVRLNAKESDDMVQSELARFKALAVKHNMKLED